MYDFLLFQPHQLQSCLLPVRSKREILCKLLLKFPKILVSFESKAQLLTFSSPQYLLLRSYFPAFVVVSYWTGLDPHTQRPGHNCSPRHRCTDCYSRKRRNQLFGLSSSLVKTHYKDTYIMRKILQTRIVHQDSLSFDNKLSKLYMS